MMSHRTTCKYVGEDVSHMVEVELTDHMTKEGAGLPGAVGQLMDGKSMAFPEAANWASATSVLVSLLSIEV